MTINELSLQDAKERTMELLGTNNPDDVSHITTELLEKEFKNPNDARTLGTFYGSYMSYGRVANRDAYLYYGDAGSSNTAPCAASNYWYLFMDQYNHQATGQSCGSQPYQAVLVFTPR